MRTRTRWMVAGGAAAFVLTPIATVWGSTPLDEDLNRGGVVLDAEAANQARAARTTAEAAPAQPATSAQPSTSVTARSGPATESAPPDPKPGTTTKSGTTATSGSTDGAKAQREPTGKKTVSAASPVSPHTSPSPVSPNTPG